MSTTIRLIADAIKRGSHYGPIRFRAAKLASTAGPKNYLGQVQAIFNDFLKRWRYVRDPADRELLHVSPDKIYEMVMGGDGGIGAGDCDDATIAMGAQLASIGFPVRIATTAPPNFPPGITYTHVFPQVLVNERWITVDPVVYPVHGFGYLTPHSRLAIWDLDGKKIQISGNALHGDDQEKGEKMPNAYFLGAVESWRDYAGLGDTSELPSEMLPDFRRVGIKDFGIHADVMGMIGGLGLAAEVDVDAMGRAWTPIMELRPEDYRYIKRFGRPYHGMLALGDNGSAYHYDGLKGWFSKIFKKVKGAVTSVAKKVLKKIPGGKYLLKLGEKLWGVAKKLVAPLTKFVGKYATKLAPIAAMIPGYGPAIAAGLYTAGKISNLMNKFGVKITGPEGKLRKVKFKSDKQAKAFTAALKKSAEALKQSKRVKSAVRGRRLSTPPNVIASMIKRRRPLLKARAA